MMRRFFTPKRLTLGLLLALALSLATAYLLWPSTKPAPVATQAVSRGDMRIKVLAMGEIQALNQVDVGAQVSGQIKTLKVKLGQRVAKGELLAEIDPTLAQNDMLAAQASLEGLRAQKRSAQAQLRQSELALARQRALRAIDASAQQDIETAQAQYTSAKSAMESFSAQLKSAHIGVQTLRVKLAQTRIVAPMDGEVVSIVAQEGQTVNAAQQAPVILRLADLSTVLVKADVSEADVIRVRIGQSAQFSILGDSEHLYRGKVHAIEPAPSGYSGNTLGKMGGPVFYSVLFTAANPEGKLRLAMTAQASILVAEAKAVLQIPISALGTKRPDGAYNVRISTARSGSAQAQIETRPVRLGLGNNMMFEVVSGLKEGEQVVLESISEPAPASDSDFGTRALSAIE